MRARANSLVDADNFRLLGFRRERHQVDARNENVIRVSRCRSRSPSVEKLSERSHKDTLLGFRLRSRSESSASRVRHRRFACSSRYERKFRVATARRRKTRLRSVREKKRKSCYRRDFLALLSWKLLAALLFARRSSTKESSLETHLRHESFNDRLTQRVTSRSIA